MVTCQPFRSLKATTYWSIYWLITLINNNGGPPLFSDVLLFCFLSCLFIYPLPFSQASQLMQCLFSQSVSSAAPWLLLPWLGTDMPVCFLLKVGGWKQCFPLQSSHHSFDALQIFCSPFYVKFKKYTLWMMRARWNMHDWSYHSI